MKEGLLMLDIKVTLTQNPKQKPADESALGEFPDEGGDVPGGGTPGGDTPGGEEPGGDSGDNGDNGGGDGPIGDAE